MDHYALALARTLLAQRDGSESGFASSAREAEGRSKNLGLSRNRNFHTFDNPQGRAALRLVKRINALLTHLQARSALCEMRFEQQQLHLKIENRDLKCVFRASFERDAAMLLLDQIALDSSGIVGLTEVRQAMTLPLPQALGSRRRQ